MTVIRFDHSGQEFFAEQEVGHIVDIEDFAQAIFGNLEDRFCISNTSIVDENSGLAMLFADQSRRTSDRTGIGDVELVEELIGIW